MNDRSVDRDGPAPERGTGDDRWVVGSVAEETERLLRVLRVESAATAGPEWSTPSFGMPFGPGLSVGSAGASRGTAAGNAAGDAAGDAAGNAAAGAGERHAPDTCGWCPLCRGVAWLRSADEDTVDRLLQGASMVASALVELAGQWSRPPTPADHGRPDPTPARDSSAQHSRTQRSNTRHSRTQHSTEDPIMDDDGRPHPQGSRGATRRPRTPRPGEARHGGNEDPP